MKKRRSIWIAGAVAVYFLLLCLLVAVESAAPAEAGATITTMGQAIWYSLVTMTTVGYGDAAPVTGAGRVIGALFLLLSAGALDQLYLAVRLAVCQLVLPAEKNVPLVLDDALANFDDDRCAAALDWLRQEAEHRQILLFTCHSREAARFRDDPAVRIADLQ